MEFEDILNTRNQGEGEPEKESPLKSLKVDLDFFKESMLEVAQELLEEGYTSYPIFIAHQHEVRIGEVILDKKELNTQWTVNISSLEEFVENHIIKEDRKASFIKKFKSPKDFMCVFVVVPQGANFIFYPYHEEKTK
ncbi:hypothetical protein J5U18_00735 [Sphingobacteriaceae bacterium WQ 2009]|uniref:Uncharacterized protein n=1 Tax=Rhinopithecimicrobium faecis TaxID=2820698 RepID=A0A8T4H522_9SPHI|nr:hypothetical protein [Sphingobacteriaceae bacterium WQ 2009]